MQQKNDKSIQLFGLSFFGRKRSELLIEIASRLSISSKVSYIFTPNPEQIVQATQDKRFFHVLTTASILIPDGIGLVWASRLLARKNHQPALQERIAGIDLLEDVLRLAADKHYSVLAIGGREVSLKNAPDSLIFQWLEGYRDIKKPTQAEEENVSRVLQATQPVLVVVAFGAPYQEEWVVAHAPELQKSGVKLALVVGGGLDYLSGSTRRAPQIWKNLGMEWLYRLVTQPWRWRRQLRLFSFIGITLREFLR